METLARFLLARFTTSQTLLCMLHFLESLFCRLHYLGNLLCRFQFGRLYLHTSQFLKSYLVHFTTWKPYLHTSTFQYLQLSIHNGDLMACAMTCKVKHVIEEVPKYEQLRQQKIEANTKKLESLGL